MQHKGTKVVKADRLLLRKFRIDDAEQMFQNWASDVEVTKFLTWPPHPDADCTRELLASWINRYSEWWGRGIMPKALRAVIVDLLGEVGFNRVVARHDKNNPKSGRVMQKAGMKYEGTLRAAGKNNQGIYDRVHYSILRDDLSQSIKKRYGSNMLNEIILYFMRTVLHLQKSGIEDLPLANSFPEPIRRFLDIAIELIIDGQPPEVSALILDTEYDMTMRQKDITTETVLALRVIKELSWHIHYDEDYYGYMLMTENLWGNSVSEYAARTFYPNLPDEIKDKYHIHDLIKHMPPEMFRLEDY